MFLFRAAAGPNQTVFDDNAPDMLTGGQGQDWFLAAVGDDDHDRAKNEIVTALTPP